MSERRKRKVIIKFGPRAAEDPEAILKAVMEVLDPAVVRLEIPDAPNEAPADESPRSVANEPLETQARQRAAAHLEKQAVEKDAVAVSRGRAPNTRSPDKPEEIVAKRNALAAWVREKGAKGVKIAAKVVPALEKLVELVTKHWPGG